jgi:hypothetical protein
MFPSMLLCDIEAPLYFLVGCSSFSYGNTQQMVRESYSQIPFMG